MKILVIDDNQSHRAAAQKQFQDHELTVVGSYDDAEKLFVTQYDRTKVEAILSERGIVNKSPHGWDADYRQARHEAEQQSIVPFSFEAVLVDLLMPASDRAQVRNSRFAGQEMPVGIFLALLAAKAGAKHVAVFTDSDHHSHPASACFDAFNEHETMLTPLAVENAKLFLCNNRNWLIDDRDGVVREKDWKALLEYMLSK